MGILNELCVIYMQKYISHHPDKRLYLFKAVKDENTLRNTKLASCLWGPATAHGEGLLTEMYVIYMETCTSHRTMSVGPMAAAGEAVTDAMTDGRKSRKYIRMFLA